MLRFDRAELEGTTLVVRVVEQSVREARRTGPTPLGYLYERPASLAPAEELHLDAGHYDAARAVWCFSGDVVGMPGLTEPLVDPTVSTEVKGDRDAR